MAARSIQESINLLENTRRKAHDEIALRKLIIKRFPDSSILLDRIEDGTLVYLCNAVGPENSTGIHYVYHPIHNYFVIRPYILIMRRKSFTKVFSQNAYKVGRTQILEVLNLFGAEKKVSNLPESYQNLFGTIFNSSKEMQVDQTYQIASENAVPEPEIKEPH